MQVNFNRSPDGLGKNPTNDKNVIEFPSNKIKASNFLSNVNVRGINSGSDLYQQLKQTNAYPLEILKSIIYEKAKIPGIDKSEMIKKIYSCIVEITSIIAKNPNVNVTLNHDLISFRRDCVMEMSAFYLKNCNPSQDLSDVINTVKTTLGLNSASWTNSINALKNLNVTETEIQNEINDERLSPNGTENAWSNSDEAGINLNMIYIENNIDSSSNVVSINKKFFEHVFDKGYLLTLNQSKFKQKLSELKRSSGESVSGLEESGYIRGSNQVDVESHNSRGISERYLDESSTGNDVESEIDGSEYDADDESEFSEIGENSSYYGSEYSEDRRQIPFLGSSFEGVSERLAVNKIRLRNLLGIVEENESQLVDLTRQVGELNNFIQSRKQKRDKMFQLKLNEQQRQHQQELKDLESKLKASNENRISELNKEMKRITEIQKSSYKASLQNILQKFEEQQQKQNENHSQQLEQLQRQLENLKAQQPDIAQKNEEIGQLTQQIQVLTAQQEEQNRAIDELRKSYENKLVDQNGANQRQIKELQDQITGAITQYQKDKSNYEVLITAFEAQIQLLDSQQQELAAQYQETMNALNSVMGDQFAQQPENVGLKEQIDAITHQHETQMAKNSASIEQLRLYLSTLKGESESKDSRALMQIGSLGQLTSNQFKEITARKAPEETELEKSHHSPKGLVDETEDPYEPPQIYNTIIAITDNVEKSYEQKLTDLSDLEITEENQNDTLADILYRNYDTVQDDEEKINKLRDLLLQENLTEKDELSTKTLQNLKELATTKLRQIKVNINILKLQIDLAKELTLEEDPLKNLSSFLEETRSLITKIANFTEKDIYQTELEELSNAIKVKCVEIINEISTLDELQAIYTFIETNEDIFTKNHLDELKEVLIERRNQVIIEGFKTTINAELDLRTLSNLKHEITRFCDENKLRPDELITLLHEREKEVVNKKIDEILNLKQGEDEKTDIELIKYTKLAKLGHLLTKTILKDEYFESNEILTANNNSALKKLFGEDFKIQNMNKLANTELEEFKKEKAIKIDEEQRIRKGTSFLNEAIDSGISKLIKLKDSNLKIDDTLGTYSVDDERLKKLSSLLKIDEATDSGVSKDTTIKELIELIDKKVAALKINAVKIAEELLREEDEASEKARVISELKNTISEAVTKEGLFPEKLNNINNKTLTIGALNLSRNKLDTIKNQLKLKKGSSIKELTFNQLKTLIKKRSKLNNITPVKYEKSELRQNSPMKTLKEEQIKLKEHNQNVQKRNQQRIMIIKSFEERFDLDQELETEAKDNLQPLIDQKVSLANEYMSFCLYDASNEKSPLEKLTLFLDPTLQVSQEQQEDNVIHELDTLTDLEIPENDIAEVSKLLSLSKIELLKLNLQGIRDKAKEQLTTKGNVSPRKKKKSDAKTKTVRNQQFLIQTYNFNINEILNNKTDTIQKIKKLLDLIGTIKVDRLLEVPNIFSEEVKVNLRKFLGPLEFETIEDLKGVLNKKLNGFKNAQEKIIKDYNEKYGGRVLETFAYLNIEKTVSEDGSVNSDSTAGYTSEEDKSVVPALDSSLLLSDIQKSNKSDEFDKIIIQLNKQFKEEHMATKTLDEISQFCERKIYNLRLEKENARIEEIENQLNSAKTFSDLVAVYKNVPDEIKFKIERLFYQRILDQITTLITKNNLSAFSELKPFMDTLKNIDLNKLKSKDKLLILLEDPSDLSPLKLADVCKRAEDLINIRKSTLEPDQATKRTSLENSLELIELQDKTPHQHYSAPFQELIEQFKEGKSLETSKIDYCNNLSVILGDIEQLNTLINSIKTSENFARLLKYIVIDPQNNVTIDSKIKDYPELHSIAIKLESIITGNILRSLPFNTAKTNINWNVLTLESLTRPLGGATIRHPYPLIGSIHYPFRIFSRVPENRLALFPKKSPHKLIGDSLKQQKDLIFGRLADYKINDETLNKLINELTEDELNKLIENTTFDGDQVFFRKKIDEVVILKKIKERLQELFPKSSIQPEVEPFGILFDISGAKSKQTEDNHLGQLSYSHDYAKTELEPIITIKTQLIQALQSKNLLELKSLKASEQFDKLDLSTIHITDLELDLNTIATLLKIPKDDLAKFKLEEFFEFVEKTYNILNADVLSATQDQDNIIEKFSSEELNYQVSLASFELEESQLQNLKVRLPLSQDQKLRMSSLLLSEINESIQKVEGSAIEIQTKVRQFQAKQKVNRIKLKASLAEDLANGLFGMQSWDSPIIANTILSEAQLQDLKDKDFFNQDIAELSLAEIGQLAKQQIKENEVKTLEELHQKKLAEMKNKLINIINNDFRKGVSQLTTLDFEEMDRTLSALGFTDSDENYNILKRILGKDINLECSLTDIKGIAKKAQEIKQIQKSITDCTNLEDLANANENYKTKQADSLNEEQNATIFSFIEEKFHQLFDLFEAQIKTEIDKLKADDISELSDLTVLSMSELNSKLEEINSSKTNLNEINNAKKAFVNRLYEQEALISEFKQKDIKSLKEELFKEVKLDDSPYKSQVLQIVTFIRDQKSNIQSRFQEALSKEDDIDRLTTIINTCNDFETYSEDSMAMFDFNEQIQQLFNTHLNFQDEFNTKTLADVKKKAEEIKAKKEKLKQAKINTALKKIDTLIRKRKGKKLQKNQRDTLKSLIDNSFKSGLTGLMGLVGGATLAQLQLETTTQTNFETFLEIPWNILQSLTLSEIGSLAKLKNEQNKINTKKQKLETKLNISIEKNPIRKLNNYNNAIAKLNTMISDYNDESKHVVSLLTDINIITKLTDKFSLNLLEGSHFSKEISNRKTRLNDSLSQILALEPHETNMDKLNQVSTMCTKFNLYSNDKLKDLDINKDYLNRLASLLEIKEQILEDKTLAKIESLAKQKINQLTIKHVEQKIDVATQKGIDQLIDLGISSELLRINISKLDDESKTNLAQMFPKDVLDIKTFSDLQAKAQAVANSENRANKKRRKKNIADVRKQVDLEQIRATLEDQLLSKTGNIMDLYTFALTSLPEETSIKDIVYKGTTYFELAKTLGTTQKSIEEMSAIDFVIALTSKIVDNIENEIANLPDLNQFNTFKKDLEEKISVIEDDAIKANLLTSLKNKEQDLKINSAIKKIQNMLKGCKNLKELRGVNDIYKTKIQSFLNDEQRTEMIGLIEAQFKTLFEIYENSIRAQIKMPFVHSLSLLQKPELYTIEELYQELEKIDEIKKLLIESNDEKKRLCNTFYDQEDLIFDYTRTKPEQLRLKLYEDLKEDETQYDSNINNINKFIASKKQQGQTFFNKITQLSSKKEKLDALIAIKEKLKHNEKIASFECKKQTILELTQLIPNCEDKTIAEISDLANQKLNEELEQEKLFSLLSNPGNNFLGVVGLYPVTQDMKNLAQNTTEYLKNEDQSSKRFDTYATNLLRCEDQFVKTKFDDLAAKLVLGYISTAKQQLSDSPKVSLLASKLSPESKKQISTARFIQSKETSINLADSFEKASNLEENKKTKDMLDKERIDCGEFKKKILEIINSDEVVQAWEAHNPGVEFRKKDDSNYYYYEDTREYYTPEFIAIINFLSHGDIRKNIKDHTFQEFVKKCNDFMKINDISATSKDVKSIKDLDKEMKTVREKAAILKNEDPSITAYNSRDISRIQHELFASITRSQDHELTIELNTTSLEFETMNLELNPDMTVLEKITHLKESIKYLNTQFNSQFSSYFGEQDLSSETLFEYFTQNPNATVGKGGPTYADITKRFLAKFSDNGQRFLQDYMYPVIVAKIQLQYLEGKKGNISDHFDEMKFVKSPASITQLGEFNFEPEVLQKLIALFMHGLDTRYPKDKRPTLLSRKQLLAISQMQKANTDGKTVTVNLNAGEGKTFLSVLIDELIDQRDKPIIHIAPFAQDEKGWEPLPTNAKHIKPGKHYWIKAQDMSSNLDKESFKQLLHEKSPYIYCDEFDRYPNLNTQLDHAHLYARCNMSATDNIQEVNVKLMESIAALQFIKESIPTGSSVAINHIKNELQSIIDLANDKSKLDELNDKIKAFITTYTDALSEAIENTKKFEKLFKLLKKIPDLISRTNDKIDFELGDGPTCRRLNLHKAKINAIDNFDQMLKDSKNLFKKGKKLQYIFQGGEFVDGTEQLTTKESMKIDKILEKIESKITSETPPVYVHLLAPKEFKDEYGINEGHPVTFTLQDGKWKLYKYENYSHIQKEQGISITLYDTFNKVGGDFELDSQEVDYQGIYFQDDAFLQDEDDLSKEVITKSLLFQMVKRDRPGAKPKVDSNLYIPSSISKQAITDPKSLLRAVSGNETSISGAVLENRKKIKQKRKLKKLFETTFHNFYHNLESLSDENKREFLKLNEKIQEDIMLKPEIPNTFKEIFDGWNKEIEDKFDSLIQDSREKENLSIIKNIQSRLGENITLDDFELIKRTFDQTFFDQLISAVSEEITKVVTKNSRLPFNEFIAEKSTKIDAIIFSFCNKRQLDTKFINVLKMFLIQVNTKIDRGQPHLFEKTTSTLRQVLTNNLKTQFANVIQSIDSTGTHIESEHMQTLKDKDLFNDQYAIMTNPNSTDFDLSYRFNRAQLYCEFEDLQPSSHVTKVTEQESSSDSEGEKHSLRPLIKQLTGLENFSVKDRIQQLLTKSGDAKGADEAPHFGSGDVAGNFRVQQNKTAGTSSPSLYSQNYPITTNMHKQTRLMMDSLIPRRSIEVSLHPPKYQLNQNTNNDYTNPSGLARGLAQIAIARRKKR